MFLRYACYGISLALLAFSPSPLRAEDADGSFYSIPIDSRDQIDLLALAGASVRHRIRNRIIVRVNDATATRLEQLGFSLTPLTRDPALPSPASLRAETWNLNPDIDTEFAALTTAYPTLARRITLGYSVENRPIHGIVIGKNVSTPREAMEVRILGCHHGNELMSVELPLRLARHLLENYASDLRIQNLVDTRDFTIVPLVNPDGRHRGSRANANLVDLNRNYGYQYHSGSMHGDTSNSGMFSQPEVRAVADHHFERNFSLSLSFHTTEAYVNYFWNYSFLETPDETLAADLAERYADLANYDPIQGYSWYQTYGDTNDWSYGMRGSIDFTIETENSEIDATFSKNLSAMLDFFEQGDRGIYGVVTDAETGDPLHAMILCDTPNWPVYTDPEMGDYYRLLLAGSYSCQVYAPGYLPQRVDVTLETDFEQKREDVALEPGGDYYAFQVPATTTAFNNPTYSPKVLGPPDGQGFALTPGGMVVLDMLGTLRPRYDAALLVHEENPDSQETYRLYISADYTGPWIFLGTGQGNQEFALSSATGTSGLRFVRVVDAGNTTPGDTASARLDAIQYLPPTQADGDEDGDSGEEADSDGDDDEGECEFPPHACFTLEAERPEDCARHTVRGRITVFESCSLSFILCPMCNRVESFVLMFNKSDGSWRGPGNCLLQPSATPDTWLLSGNCGLGSGVNSVFTIRECLDTEDNSPSCSFTCAGCLSDGDEPDGDGSDGDELDGDTPDGESPDGDEPDADEPDGDGPDTDPLPEDGDQPEDGDTPENPTDGDTAQGTGGGGCRNTGQSTPFLLVAFLVAGLVRRRARTLTPR